jgi:protein-disulfide isomerase
VEELRDQAAATGARGTPSFLVNGKLVFGYQSFEKFRQHIDEALAEP